MKITPSLKLVCGAALLAGLCLPAFSAAQSVAVAAITEHPALDDVRDGVREGLAQAGYTEAKGLKWQYQSAQNNTAVAAQIARKYVGDKPDVIVAIATPMAQAVVAATKQVPVVYAAVTDPVASQLVPSMSPSGINVAGVSDALPLEKQIALIKQVVPAAKRVGIIYNPGEINSVVVVKRLREMLPKEGLSLVEATASRTVDVGAAARSLVGKVDVIYTNTDNNVVSAYEALVKVGIDAKIPLIASDAGSVKRGAIAALGIDYRDLGRQTGRLVARILKGQAPGGIASETSDKLQLFINPAAAEQQGVTLSDKFIQSAAQIIQ